MNPLGPPAGLLSLASPLREAAYRVVVIDAAVVPGNLASVEKETRDALCFGVSLLTGPMIRGAIAACRVVKKQRPDLPVVFGGWHPSLLPEQTLKEDFVDIVVRYQGEITFREVVRKIEQGASLADVAGCSFKRDGQLRHNPDRPTARLSDFPPPSYDLAYFDLYEEFSGERKLPYATSVGCPYACNYCTDTVFCNRRFNALPALRVVQEVCELVARHRIHEVAMPDSNFLVDTRRAVEIARGFHGSGLRFLWSFQASTDLLCRLSDPEVRLLGASGVRHIGFGTESASEHVLLKMNKRHQRIGDLFETARKCRQAGIRATFNAAMNQALAPDDALAEVYNPKAAISLYYYRDWPAAEHAFKRSIELNPNFAEAPYDYALSLAIFGRFEEALVEIGRALQLDSLSLRVNLFLGRLFFLSGGYDEAIEQSQNLAVNATRIARDEPGEMLLLPSAFM